MIRDTNYYLDNAVKLSWGEGKLDKERIQILRTFIKGRKILDVGCGFGVYVDYLTRQDIEAVGVDFVPEFIEEARKNKQGTFQVASADSLPFGKDSFDTVILFNILEHGDGLKILAEAKRVARQRLIVVVPKVVDQSLADSGVIFRHYLDRSHAREYKVEDLKVLAKKLGLKISHIERVQLLPNFAIFASLFKGSTASLFINLFYKAIGKIIFMPFLRKDYFTEILAVFDKQS